MLCSATPIHKKDGEIVGVVATLQDMTPLEDLVRQRAEFLSMVSHELRNPLASIKGSVAALLGSPSSSLDSVDTRQFLRIIDQQTDRMNGLLSMAARAQCFCLLETLEYPVKGGRIGRAQAANGEALDRVNRNRPRGDVEPSHEARCFTLGGCSGWMRCLEKRRRVLRRLIRGLTMSGKSPPFRRYVLHQLDIVGPAGSLSLG